MLIRFHFKIAIQEICFNILYLNHSGRFSSAGPHPDKFIDAIDTGILSVVLTVFLMNSGLKVQIYLISGPAVVSPVNYLCCQ